MALIDTDTTHWALVKASHEGAIEAVYGPLSYDQGDWLMKNIIEGSLYRWTLMDMTWWFDGAKVDAQD